MSINLPVGRVYIGVRGALGDPTDAQVPPSRLTIGATVLVVDVLEESSLPWLPVRTLQLEPSLAVANHSPTGFEWGYMGSGPSQLALALLLDMGTPREEAVLFYQELKRKLVALLPRGGWVLPVSSLAMELAAVRMLALTAGTVSQCVKCGRLDRWVVEGHCGACRVQATPEAAGPEDPRLPVDTHHD